MSREIVLSMVITEEGLDVAHYGNVGDADHFSAYLLELKLVSQKILNELQLEGVEEIYIRSKSGCISLLPIFEKGYLACLSTPSLGSTKLMMYAYKFINRIYDLI
jgi:predicted regulator of Ras-like GTPase activity (Roadblock/LC7/MglB family)